MVGVMIVLTLLALLIIMQALLAAISVFGRLLWSMLGLALLYLMVIQLLGH